MNAIVPAAATPLPTQDTASKVAGTGRRLLSKAEVAARLGCSERSLERLVKQGRFPPPRRYGRQVVWFESVVDQMLALDEQRQLQWFPAPEDVRAGASVSQPVEPSVASAIPAAHELEPEPESCKPVTRNNKRRSPGKVTTAELQALSRAMESSASR